MTGACVVRPIGGGESGYIAVRSDDPNVVFAGTSGGRIDRYDHRTRQQRDVSVWPQVTYGLAAADYKYRYQWTSPVVLSPHDPGVLYSGANCVFRSVNEGSSWEQSGAAGLAVGWAHAQE